MKETGKYGLVGNTGLVGEFGTFHISAPYDCNGKVFVGKEHPELGETWDRVDASQADPSEIITCSMCDKPAVSLDHFYPYHSEMTRCEEHYNKEIPFDN